MICSLAHTVCTSCLRPWVLLLFPLSPAGSSAKGRLGLSFSATRDQGTLLGIRGWQSAKVTSSGGHTPVRS